jgi:hypothetical protein
MLLSHNEDPLLALLRARFERNLHRHASIAWEEVRERLDASPVVLPILRAMETSGGEPDVIGWDDLNARLLYCDCAPESPAGRRSLCYDEAAWNARKKDRPAGSAVDAASAMGVALMTEAQYHTLQLLGEFDTKTSTWLATPADIRSLGGALFGDRRYGRVFVYHNGAESYYASRGFRTLFHL